LWKAFPLRAVSRRFQLDRIDGRELLKLPYRDRLALFRSAMAWRMVDLTESEGRRIDLVIATRFPTYAVRHPNKVIWLVHQHRQAYDLLGTPYSDFSAAPVDQRALAMIRALDRRALGEAQRLFSISRTTAERLKRYCNLDAEVLYPPPKLGDAYESGAPGDYVLAVGRLDAMKRFDLLIRALAETSAPVRAVIAGEGPEREPLLALAQSLGVASRLLLPGRVDDAELVRLYSGALAVLYAPHNEDYGYVTVEAFRSGRPLVTTADAGGVLEFVEDGVNGLVCASGTPRLLAAAVDRLWQDRELAARLGAAGRERVRDISWDRVIEQLTSRL